MGITRAIADDFAERYGLRCTGDPQRLGSREASTPRPAAGVAPEPDRGTINLVHTGSLSIPERRDPRGFFQALETLVDEDAELARKLRLYVGGLAHQSRPAPARGALTSRTADGEGARLAAKK